MLDIDSRQIVWPSGSGVLAGGRADDGVGARAVLDNEIARILLTRALEQHAQRYVPWTAGRIRHDHPDRPVAERLLRLAGRRLTGDDKSLFRPRYVEWAGNSVRRISSSASPYEASLLQTSSVHDANAAPGGDGRQVSAAFQRSVTSPGGATASACSAARDNRTPHTDVRTLALDLPTRDRCEPDALHAGLAASVPGP